MEVLYARCAGLDVHQKSVVACVRIHGPEGRAQTSTRTFATDTAALLELSAWLEENQCSHVVMEATGVSRRWAATAGWAAMAGAALPQAPRELAAEVRAGAGAMVVEGAAASEGLRSGSRSWGRLQRAPP